MTQSAKFKGSVFRQVGPITLGCISPEAHDLLDRIMEAWKQHEAELKKNDPDHEPSHYAFAYWLVRWSGLIQPAS